MKKAGFVLSLLALATSAAWAQSSVQLYGIIDAGVRITNNEGSGANPGAKITRVVGGGMSSSRFGMNISEDLGGGLKALANLEHRVEVDSGTQQAANFWQQSWVGLQGGFGRLTLGRQYNVLFDLVTSTYVSYPYSPYAERYKPEVGLALGARADNMVKYTIAQGGLTAELQASAGEGSATGGKTMGGMLKYAANGFAAGAGQQYYQFGSGKKIKATTFGGSYRNGPWYVNAGYGVNKLDSGLAPTDLAVLGSLWGNFANGGFGYNSGALLAKANKREMTTFGVGYQVTPQLNLGGHYYKAKQTGVDASVEVKADFLTLAADYAFSKRTDAYLEFDNTKLKGPNVSLSSAAGPNGKTSRNGMMVGVRHRF